VTPLERYYRVSEVLTALAPARRMAILAVLARRGPCALGVAIFHAGCRTAGALRDAAEMEKAGLVTVSRPTGRNLSELCAITPAGRRALAMVDALDGEVAR
jgi:DNA-binding MarR family transcriptional regulator